MPIRHEVNPGAEDAGDLGEKEIFPCGDFNGNMWGDTALRRNRNDFSRE